MRHVEILLIGLALAGCSSGAQYAMREYSGVSAVPFTVEDDDVYRVFDKPAESRLMITPSIAKAAAMGAVGGATMGIADVSGIKPTYERAAVAYLASTGRHCRIVDGYLVQRPQWEFKYDCRPTSPAR